MLAMDGWAFLNHLQRLRLRMIAAVGPLLREQGLQASTLWLLTAVERHPHPTELCREMGLPAPTISRLLKGLEAEGYLVRETVPEDLRRYRFLLTPKGAAVQAEAHGLMEAAVGSMLLRLPLEDRADLDRILALLANGEGDTVGK